MSLTRIKQHKFFSFLKRENKKQNQCDEVKEMKVTYHGHSVITVETKDHHIILIRF